MTTPTATEKRTRTGTTKASRAAARTKKSARQTDRAPAASRKNRKGKTSAKSHGTRTFTVTVPSLPSLDEVTDDAAKAAKVPVKVAREVLPAKGGLPLYVGLGAMGAVGVLEWPVAVGIGIGYAVLRGRNGPLSPATSSK
ncbi:MULTISPECIES: hypothetical protein [unclassified Streptomyces]|uniref:hypothetical protein n=1 Tax=unclassified Streptomyces TaxID=2593676 RepID=UPI00081F38A0|nr:MULTISPECIES: hypothetical protein [unclassified Streptomyces]MYZ38079.1 hypothetical protein [Streptomyces sp. SID4917]SCF96133.1 hypothetical protein GA0115259_105694 [Streptomyces sp. MnatMP-M17]